MLLALVIHAELPEFGESCRFSAKTDPIRKTAAFPRFFRFLKTAQISPKIFQKSCKCPDFRKKLEFLVEPEPDDGRLQTNPKDAPAFPMIYRGVFFFFRIRPTGWISSFASLLNEKIFMTAFLFLICGSVNRENRIKPIHLAPRSIRMAKRLLH